MSIIAKSEHPWNVAKGQLVGHNFTCPFPNGYTDTFGDDFASRELLIGGRVGLKLLDNALPYGTTSYSNLRAVGLSLTVPRSGSASNTHSATVRS